MPFDVQELVRSFFSVNSTTSVLLRAGLWFVVAIIIIASTDTANLKSAQRNLRSSLGGFLFFLVLCGGLVYLLFGFVPIT